MQRSATGALGAAMIAVIAPVVLLAAGAKRGLTVAALALVVNALVAGPPVPACAKPAHAFTT